MRAVDTWREGRGWVGSVAQPGFLQVVVAWGTEQVRRSGEVVLLAKVHTDADIQAFEFCFDETR